MTTKKFQQLVYAYYAKNKRVFPWRETRDPYAILVSEIMLQQTQTERVIIKYNEWLALFPTFKALARAPLGNILRTWQGLGYNRRALALKHLAEIVTKEHSGTLPENYEELLKLPGIGPYTAGAVMAFAFNKPLPIIETNIRTVFIHHFFPKDHGQIHDKEILSYVEKTLDQNNPRDWYWALMDYGVHLKKIHGNLNTKSRHYVKQSSFIGSNRQMRAALLRNITLNTHGASLKKLEVCLISEKIKVIARKSILKNLKDLEREGFIKKSRNNYFIHS